MGNIKKWPLIFIYGKMDGFIRGYWSTYPIYVWLNPGENWNFDGDINVGHKNGVGTDAW